MSWRRALDVWHYFGPDVAFHFGAPPEEGGYFWISVFPRAAWCWPRRELPRWADYGFGWTPWFWYVRLFGRESRYVDELVFPRPS